MAYSKEVFEAATARMQKRRRSAFDENKLVKSRLYAQIPRLAGIEKELARTGTAAARAILVSGGDSKGIIEKLKNKNLDLQASRAELLVKNGYPPDILRINYHCEECRDTGYVGDSICSCFRTILREEACKIANSGSPLPLFTFDTFDITYYPDKVIEKYGINVRSHMNQIFLLCKKYADEFRSNGPSLLMLGQTGLGKTHLALSIANSVIVHGTGVIYDTAQNIFTRMEEEYFGRSPKKYSFLVFDCDLLILDELPDFVSNFAVNSFYNIINTRTLAHKPMIVSTNLSEKELSAKYGQRIFSRLIGEFQLLKFFGNDIRQLKLRRKAEKGLL